MTHQNLSNQTRLCIAALTGLVGLVTAFAMTELGGNLRHMLPDTGFHLAAMIGAGVAGFVFADGFGRPGGKGMLWAALSAIGATLAGSGLGAMLILPLPHAQMGVFVFGWVTLAEAATHSFLSVKLWVAAMVMLHLATAKLRHQAEISP
ncbi:hypothetical protein C1J03_08375 [Sulfitobacter sp. SK012]|uniref:hypothetical protein n=1 Tax=Sulfitobacter sp. SK012 TaxID=1389005 RepID=UPI000E09F153|nr:hypothetical protein [Sulfitobacter sp. SK012]AXI46029.1 hypothetical protein C1J03_08375 [Sulfitobacter sp. SK012]